MSEWTTLNVTKVASLRLHRAKALMRFISGQNLSVSEALIKIADYYLEKNDPRKKS
jgi:hypothetical protein